MNDNQLIEATVAFVKEKLKSAEGGHDWWHVYRVWKSALHIGQSEGADLLIVQLGALLHDVADAKFHDGDETLGPQLATSFLRDQGVDDGTIQKVVHIVEHISFKGGFNEHKEASRELKVVQDADRLDAIGAIGVARTFNYGGFKNRPMYDPSVPPADYKNREEYKANTAPTINHFYEKLLLLKDKMNTPAGRALAEKRHSFMEKFLNQFYKEWEGEY